LAAAAGFDHDVTPGSCQARLPLRAIRLQREVAAAAAGPGEGTTTVGASPWLELEVVMDWWSWCLMALRINFVAKRMAHCLRCKAEWMDQVGGALIFIAAISQWTAGLCRR